MPGRRRLVTPATAAGPSRGERVAERSQCLQGGAILRCAYSPESIPCFGTNSGDSREKDDAHRNGRDHVVRRDERPAAGTDRFRPVRRAGDLAPRVPRRHGRVRRRGVRHGRRRPHAACRPRRDPTHLLRPGRAQHPRHCDRAARLQLACRRQVGRSDVVGLGSVRPGHARHRRRSGTGVRRQQRRHVAVRCRRPQRPRRQQRVRQPQDHLRRRRHRRAGERGRRPQGQGRSRRLRRGDRADRRPLVDRRRFALQPPHHRRHPDAAHRTRGRPRSHEDRGGSDRDERPRHLEQLRKRTYPVGYLPRVRGELQRLLLL